MSDRKRHRGRQSASIVAAFAAAVTCTSADAHHSYGEYDACTRVTFEGTIDDVTWANPHVTLRLVADDVGPYLVEWFNLQQMRTAHVEKGVLKPGERIVVTGTVNRNPERKIMTLLTEIRRPSDGWTWQRVRKTPPSCSRS